MRFANIERHGTSAVALITEEGRAVLLSALAPWLEGWTFPPASTDELIAAPQKVKEITEAWQRAAAEGAELVTEDEVTFLPAVLNPGKLICIGLNYKRHAEETGMPLPEKPVVFGKFADSLTAHGSVVPYPKATRRLDYEAELAIVIGRTAVNVTEEEALDYVFGYCCANDLSARDLQGQSSQWLLGKTGEGFAPLGPFIVPAGEIPDPNALKIGTRVNGIIVQDSHTSDMIFSCRELISFLSQHMKLRPGDVILTGTPEGVILGKPKEERVWLKPGDEMTIFVEGLGELTNVIGD
ncbi:5-carboxymethyl-2-hydroxymuconate isomerase [Saccharibacillus sp. O16]|nr:5-carboxymethyl-2-hydroxymuconate isomerase [Saccharibacillus sp. O16]